MQIPTIFFMFVSLALRLPSRPEDHSRIYQDEKALSVRIALGDFIFSVKSRHRSSTVLGRGLMEIIRVLKPGGRLLLTLRQAHGKPPDPSAERLSRQLVEHGFKRENGSWLL
jgi:SAM-dependent methyltransferase